MKQHLINIHIPKTAGTTLRDTLGEIFNQIPHKPSFVFGPYEGGYADLRDGFIKLLPQLFDREERMISGHYRYRDIADVISPVRERVALITFLRDPVQRTLSDYFYCISEAHTDPEGFKNQFPTFEDYMQSPGDMNKTLEYLKPFDSATSEEALYNAIEKFDFVGITENFDEDFQIVLQALGGKSQPALRNNVNRNRQAMQEALERYEPQLREILADEYIIYNGILAHRGLSLPLKR